MSLLFPNKCFFCGEIIVDTKVSICKECLRTMPLIKGERCGKCGRELGGCYCETEKLAFERNVSLMRYEGPAEKIVKRMKFGGFPQLAEYMGDDLAKYIKIEYAAIDFDFVTYVPMHPIKEFKRKYNQAEMLANRVGKLLGLEVVDTLSKKFSFKSQKQLGRSDRIKAARGKYSAKCRLDGKTVLLIDDVLTVGATLNECARVLMSAGAAAVYTATFAITCKK